MKYPLKRPYPPCKNCKNSIITTARKYHINKPYCSQECKDTYRNKLYEEAKNVTKKTTMPPF